MLDARRIAMSSRSHYQQAERLYTTTAIAVGIVPKWLKKTGKPNVSILTSSTGGCLEALRQKRADQIFLPSFEGDERDPQLSYTKIAEDPLILAKSPKAEKPIAFKGKTLSGPIMMHAPGTIFGQQIARHLAERDITCERDIVCRQATRRNPSLLLKKGLAPGGYRNRFSINRLRPARFRKNWRFPVTLCLLNERNKQGYNSSLFSYTSGKSFSSSTISSGFTFSVSHFCARRNWRQDK